MKNIPITLCIPEDILRDLYTYVSARKRSKYVAELLSNSLKIKKEQMSKDFKSSSRDISRNGEINLWNELQGDLND